MFRINTSDCYMSYCVKITKKGNTQVDPKVNPTRGSDFRARDASLDIPTPLLCGEDISTLKPETTPEELSSFGTAATAVSGFIGVVALIQGPEETETQFFKKQLRPQTNFLHLSLELSCHVDAMYSNTINLALCKEDDFAVYANMSPF